VLTNNNTIIQKVEVVMPFGNSDHKTISMEVRLFIPKLNQSSRKMYMYSQGQCSEMDNSVRGMDWTSRLAKYTHIHQRWTAFKNILFDILDGFVPTQDGGAGTMCNHTLVESPQSEICQKESKKDSDNGKDKWIIHTHRSNPASVR
jgi:hypothetical protein